MNKYLHRVLACVMFGATLLLTGISEARTLDEILASKKLVVGVNPSLPPLTAYNDKNELDGFDVDLAKKYAEMLGVELELVKVGPNDRVPFLASGKIDLCLGAMTRNAKRAKVIDFTIPLYTESLAVLTTEEKGFKDVGDLNKSEVKLVTVRGTTGATYIKEHLPNAETILVDDQAEEVVLVAQGRADAVITVVDFHGPDLLKHKANWKVLPTPIELYYNSAGIAKGNYTLRDWLNVASYELHKSGWILETWKKWFGIDMAFPVPASPFF